MLLRVVRACRDKELTNPCNVSADYRIRCPTASNHQTTISTIGHSPTFFFPTSGDWSLSLPFVTYSHSFGIMPFEFEICCFSRRQPSISDSVYLNQIHRSNTVPSRNKTVSVPPSHVFEDHPRRQSSGIFSFDLRSPPDETIVNPHLRPRAIQQPGIGGKSPAESR